jgi:hypothetical protein
VVEPLDLALDGVDVRFGVGGGGDEQRTAESDAARRRENPGAALPAVGHKDRLLFV